MTWWRLAAAVAWCASIASAAESVLTARAADYSADSRFGRFEIRAEMQGTVDLTADGTQLVAEVYTGSKFTGAASTYTQPIPRKALRGFRALAIGAAKVKVIEEPSPSNGYKARLRVTNKDLKLANIRLLWEVDQKFSGTALPVTPSPQDNALMGRMVLVGRFANDVELQIRGGRVEADGPFLLQSLKLSQPLPAQAITKLRKQGKAMIVEEPSAVNRFTATIAISKVKPEGEDRTIQLIWTR